MKRIRINAPKGYFVIRGIFRDRGINVRLVGCGERSQVSLMKNNLPVKKIVRILVASRMELGYSMQDVLTIKKWLKQVRDLELKIEYIGEGVDVELSHNSLAFNINGLEDTDRLY